MARRFEITVVEHDESDDDAVSVLEGIAHYSHGKAGKIARDWLVARRIWSDTVEPDVRVDPIWDVAANLTHLILVSMEAATNQDLAADGPVDSRAERRVWETIVGEAETLRDMLQTAMNEVNQT